MEIWKTVNGYEGLYEVSNKGRVRSLDKIVPKWDGQRLLKGKILKGGITRFGYVKVILTKEKTRRTFLVHRLVAEAFIEKYSIVGPRRSPLIMASITISFSTIGA